MMRCLKCRKVNCNCLIPKEIWLCYDIDNGDDLIGHPVSALVDQGGGTKP